MKRIIVFVTVIFSMMLLFASMPTTALAATVKTTTPSYLNDSQVKQRLDDLANCLVGKYFTVSGNPCNKPGIKNHGCSNCNIQNVVNSNTFKSAVKGKVPSILNVSPMVHYDGSGKGSSYINGCSCCGFANFAEWYIFAGTNTDAVATINMTKNTVAFNYTNMKNLALPGDVIRLDGHHSVIVYSINQTSVTIIDCNSNYKDDGNCKIRKYDTKYTDYSKVGITRAANYQSYTIYYNANGGSGAPASQAKVKDVELKLSTSKPFRTGYNFLGWSTNNKAKSPEYLAGAKFTVNANVTLYAVWAKKH